MVSQAGDAIGNEEKYAFGLIRDRATPMGENRYRRPISDLAISLATSSRTQ
jgi:hypothetical protein